NYTATTSGAYTAQLNALGCHSQVSDPTVVTVNPIPPTPTITPNGPTTFNAGGSVTLTSSSASGNQWYLNSSPIGGATNQTYVATASGDYTVVVTTNGCSSAASAPTTVTVILPSFSIDDVTHNEGNAGTTSFTFTVTKTGSTGVNATVNFATQNGSATDPSDNQSTSSTLTFLPSETTKTITVLVNSDTIQ